MKESHPPQQVHLGLFFFSHLYNMPIKQPLGNFLICDLLLQICKGLGAGQNSCEGPETIIFPDENVPEYQSAYRISQTFN